MVQTKQVDDDDMEPLDPALPYDPADNVLAQNATTEALETTNRGNNPGDLSQSARNADAAGGRPAARNLHQDSVSDNILANKQAEENAAKKKRRADYD